MEQAAITVREIVETALGLLRTGYVFPDLAERAAAAIEVRLADGEYDGMDEAALADLLTSQLNDICADKHLRVRTMPPQAARPEPGEPAGQRPAPRERRRLTQRRTTARRSGGSVRGCRGLFGRACGQRQLG